MPERAIALKHSEPGKEAQIFHNIADIVPNDRGNDALRFFQPVGDIGHERKGVELLTQRSIRCRESEWLACRAKDQLDEAGQSC